MLLKWPESSRGLTSTDIDVAINIFQNLYRVFEGYPLPGPEMKNTVAEIFRQTGLYQPLGGILVIDHVVNFMIYD